MKILCFEITYVGFMKKQKWQQSALAGLKINAIKELRDLKNNGKRLNDKGWYGLAEAKQAVEKYMLKNGVKPLHLK